MSLTKHCDSVPVRLFRGIIPKPVPREVLGQLLAHYLQLQVNNDQPLDVSQLNEEDAHLMGAERSTNG